MRIAIASGFQKTPPPVRRRRAAAGFTLIEVLVALVLVLFGAYYALRLFPAGFAAIERGTFESMATGLADRELQRWRLAAGSLPEAIVWAEFDATTGGLLYRTDYDPMSLVPNRANPNWQPDSVYLPRTVIGEVLPLGDRSDPTTGDLIVPTCRLRYGPLQHILARRILPATSPWGATRTSGVVTITTARPHGLVVGDQVAISGVTSTGGTAFNGEFAVAAVLSSTQFTYNQASVADDTGGRGDAWKTTSGATDPPLFVYSTQYHRVDRASALVSSTSTSPGDREQFFIDYDSGTISFDHSAVERRFRVEFTYLTGVVGSPAQRTYEMTDTLQMITVPANWDSAASATATGQGPIPLWPRSGIAIVASPGGATVPASSKTVTITTTASHGVVAGQTVVMTGVTSTGGTNFNGSFKVTSSPTPTTFTYDLDAVSAAGDSGGGGTVDPLPVGFQGVVRLTERVHQAFIYDSGSAPTGPGHFAVSGDIANPAATLRFDGADAGKTVNVDYRVRDWQILVHEAALYCVGKSLASATWNATAQTATVTTSVDHGLEIGDWVRIIGVDPVAWNGVFLVTEVPSSRAFTYKVDTDPGAVNDLSSAYAKSPVLRLPVKSIKSRSYRNAPRQPDMDRIVPGDNTMVMVIDTETGARVANTEIWVNFGKGTVYLLGDSIVPQEERTFRVYYRAAMDWAVQPIKAAADYTVLGGAVPSAAGYRSAVLQNGNELWFGHSEVARSIVANYYVYFTAGVPTPVTGELKQIAAQQYSGDGLTYGRVTLAHTPAWGDIRVQGASLRGRVTWAMKGATRTVDGEWSPETWRHVEIETFLRR